MGNEKLGRISPSFENSDALESAWEGNREHEGEGTYARGRYEELEKREKEIAEMIGVPDSALFNAGMATIATVIESEHLHSGDVVLCGKDMYGKTSELINSLEEQGVQVVLIDSGSEDEISSAIEKEKPRLIFLESVANATEMQVCDVEKLAELGEQAEIRYRDEYNPNTLLQKYIASRESLENFIPEMQKEILENLEEFKESSNPMVLRETVRIIEKAAGLSRKEAVRETARLAKYVLKEEREELTIVIDNTLSSPVLRNPLTEVGDSDVSVVVVESGTKHFQEGEDKITCGVAYSNSEEKLNHIKETRTRMGTYLQPNDEALLPKQLVLKMSETVKLQASNALQLAALLENVTSVNEVNHPNLDSHKDSELAEELSPDGLVTLFYIKVDDPMSFIDKVKKAGGDSIEIGTSFGHKKTRLLPNLRNSCVRIAAGAEDETEFERVMESFRTALTNSNND